MRMGLSTRGTSSPPGKFIGSVLCTCVAELTAPFSVDCPIYSHIRQHYSHLFRQTSVAAFLAIVHLQ